MEGVPELPEISAHAERLHERYAGAALERFEPLSFTALKTPEPSPDVVRGQGLQAVTRRGKHLLLGFAAATFVVHLMQGGRLEPDTKSARRPRGGVARWHFAGDVPPLLLTEGGTERRAGVWVVAGDPLAAEPLCALGPDADALTRQDLARLLGAHRMRVHGFLRDQRILAGLGRRLANEVCHRARLSPFARTDHLEPEQATSLWTAVRDCVADSLADERGHDRMVAARERPAAVHGRTGQACPACGDTVREVAYRDYTVHYCPACQTGGAILADNTRSRLGIARDEQGLGRRARGSRPRRGAGPVG